MYNTKTQKIDEKLIMSKAIESAMATVRFVRPAAGSAAWVDAWRVAFTTAWSSAWSDIRSAESAARSIK